MAEDVITTSSDSNGGGDTAVADRPGDGESRDMRALAAEALAPLAKGSAKKDKKSKKKQDEDDDLEYEVEFATPFGKIEFEFEPLEKKQKKDQQKKERAEREAAKAAAKAAKLAEKRALKGDVADATRGGGRGSGLLIALIIFGIVAAAIVIAVWLFARPGEDEDAIPAEFRADDALDPEPVAPGGFVARMKNRATSAVRAGKQASREAQSEQQRKFEQMSGR